MTSSRVVRKRARSTLFEGLLQGLLVAEVMDPSPEVWIVSPWMRNVPVIDNRTGGFNWLEDTWANRHVSLLDWVYALCSRGSRVTLVTTSGEGDQDFLRNAQQVKSRLAAPDCLVIREEPGVNENGGLHAKELLTDHFHWLGSMNFTLPGLQSHQETVRVLLSDLPEFQDVAAELRGMWG